MSNKESLKNWGTMLVLLLIAGSATLWPTISAQISGSTPIEPEAQTITINLPQIGLGSLPESITLSSLQAMVILFAVVAAVVVGTGVLLAFAYALIAKQVTSVAEDDQFKVHAAALDQREKEKIKKLGENRTVAPIPEHKMPRWSVVSTSLIILTFVALFGMLINGTFVPEGEYLIRESLVNSAIPVAGGLVLIALIFIVWRMRPETLDKLEASDNESIPWDFIWVLLTGVIVVGLGIGALVFFNVPA